MGGLLFVLGVCFLGVGYVAGTFENMNSNEKEKIALIEYENIDKYNEQRGRAHRILDELRMIKSYEYSFYGYDLSKVLNLIEEDLDDGLIEIKCGSNVDAKEVAAEAILYRLMLESGEDYLFPEKKFVGARLGAYTSEELKKEKSKEQLAMNFKTENVEEAKEFQKKYDYLIRYYLAPVEYGGCYNSDKRGIMAQLASHNIHHYALEIMMDNPEFITKYFNIEKINDRINDYIISNAFIYFILGFVEDETIKEMGDYVNILINNCKFNFRCPLVGYKYSINDIINMNHRRIKKLIWEVVEVGEDM